MPEDIFEAAIMTLFYHAQGDKKAFSTFIAGRKYVFCHDNGPTCRNNNYLCAKRETHIRTIS